MRKQLAALSLIILALVILSSASLVEGYTPQIDATGIVDKVINGNTFSLKSGAVIKLVDIRAPSDREAGYNESIQSLSYIRNQTQMVPFEGLEVFLDIDSSSENSSQNVFVSVAYISYNSSHYLNLNQYLIQKNHFIKINNTLNDFNPYFWGTSEIYKNTVTDNSLVNQDLFNQARFELLKNYTSQTLTHATMLVTITISIPALLFAFYKNKDQSFEITMEQKIIIYSIISIFLLALAYDACKLIYWSWMSSSVLGVLPSEALSQGTNTLSLDIQTSLANGFIAVHPVGFIYNLEKAILILLPISLLFSFFMLQLIMREQIIIKLNYFERKKKISLALILVTGIIGISLITIFYASKALLYSFIFFLYILLAIFLIGTIQKYRNDRNTARNNSTPAT
jgi:hypothetical protein